MDEAAAFPTRAWESFYVIAGSSAGALTGLQFVVLTMIAEARKARSMTRGGESIAAFGSPNVVHFCSALLVSAILSAPWGGFAALGAALAIIGVLGVAYALIVLRRTVRQTEYRPVLEDWVWHAVLPMLAYGALVHAGWVLEHGSADTLWVVGAATLLLVFIGIHNAWDTVMYITVVGLPEPAEPAAKAAPPAARPDPPAAPPRTPSTGA